MRITLDTNILVYALDRGAGARHELACQIIARAPFTDCWLTLQSISEFYAVVSRKRLASTVDAAAQARDWLAIFPTAAASASAVRKALDATVDGRASYWDALLVATAAEADCAAVLTEDLGDGTTLHGVRIINPFADDRLTPAAEDLLTAD